MHTLAKRFHNITPDRIRITFEEGSSVVVEPRSAEFFQEAFQAEGVADDGTVYRFVTDGGDDPLVAGEQTGDGWTPAGTVSDVDPADE